jgi:hypothetical protein
MSEADAATALFKSYLNESTFSAVHGAQQNDELGDAVKDFIEGRQFAIESGVDPAALERETAANDERFDKFLEKRKQIAAGTNTKKEPARSPYLYAKRIDAPLAKSEIASRMYSLLEKLRADCVGDEETQLERAARCLDIPGFCELSERIVGRLKARAA